MNDNIENNNAIMTSIGKRIESLRLQKHIKQVELANASTVSISTVRRMEAGKNFSMEALIKVLRSLDQLQDLQVLITVPPLSPVEIAKQGFKVKAKSRRVRSKEYKVPTNSNPHKVAEGLPDRPFQVFKKDK